MVGTINQEVFALSAQNFALVNKLIAYLKNDARVTFDQQELDKGTFVHCLILACMALQYINAELKVEQQVLSEQIEVDWKQNIEQMLKHRHHRLEEDELYLKLEQKIHDIMDSEATKS